ncbi:MAG: carbohydrate kinase [Verrucomicrobia bacterium]|nr:carbohydrate kinase [Verrucomicrobiota bacterium]
MSQKLILSYGEVLWDLLPEGPALGGAPCNFAYRMGTFGHSSIIISRLGKDELGESALEVMEQLEISTAGIQEDLHHPTGTVEVHLDAEQNPDYYIVPNVAYDHIETSEELAWIAGQADAICFGTLVQRSPKSKESLHWVLDQMPADSLKVYDVNLRKNCYTQKCVETSLRRAHILKCSLEEVPILADWFGMDDSNLVRMGNDLIKAWHLRYCLISLGAKGALAFSADGETVYQPGFKIKQKEPVGAGDACTAGFVHSLLSGLSLADACRTGCALGAIVATQRGATESVSPRKLNSFLRKHHELNIEPSYQILMRDPDA